MRRFRATGPDQDSALLIYGELFGRNDFVFEIFEIVVI